MSIEAKTETPASTPVWPEAGSVADKALKAYKAGDEITAIAAALNIKTSNVLQYVTYWRSKGADVPSRRRALAATAALVPKKPVEAPKPEAPKAAPQLSKKVYEIDLTATLPGAAKIIDLIRKKIINECAKPTGAPHEHAIRLQALAETVLELESA